ncbi:MAG: hypothetical protein D6E12_08680 [Desulfovibrio sp.]|nr:MAG: hypothetical protein D6E12_08680 [Desulfovibrio sp.]
MISQPSISSQGNARDFLGKGLRSMKQLKSQDSEEHAPPSGPRAKPACAGTLLCLVAGTPPLALPTAYCPRTRLE